MRRFHSILTAGLMSFTLISCAQQVSDKLESTATAPTQDIIVTSSRADSANKAQERRGLARAEMAAQAYAPAPPSLAAPAIIGRERSPYPPYYRDVGRDRFGNKEENGFKIVREEPVSTFSIDVDTDSYAFVRASLNQNVLPQPAAVRPEEMINYFPYDYAAPQSANQPFTANIAVLPSPWTAGRKACRPFFVGWLSAYAYLFGR